MKEISIITQHDISTVNGSTVRPKWQIKALEQNGIKNVRIVDKFDQSKIQEVSGTLIHAHQFASILLKNEKYIVDIHGLEHVQLKNLAGGFPISSWKRYGYIAKSIHYKKVETKLFKNAVHLVSSSEDILEKVKKIQNTTLVRNAVFIEDFLPCQNSELNIGLVGPFLPGTINYQGLDIILKIVKKFPKLKFTFIGKTNEYFRSQLDFKNTKFLGVAKDYTNTLRECNVLFAPYPKHAKYMGSKNKFLEAAACNMPIITTSSGAVDFRKDLLLVGDTIEKISEMFEQILDENNRKNLGKKLRQEIEQKYNAKIEIKKLIKLYNEFS